MKRFIFWVALWFVGSCATVQPVPPTPPVTDYAGVCAHLLDIGCGEGAAANCAATMERTDRDRLTNLHLQCLLDAGDRAQARACGSVDCE